MNTLPIDSVLPALKQHLIDGNTLILEAPPGTGKTTRVPLSLLDVPWREGRKIIMLEPRRIAARSAARFMAQLLNENVGERVGYRTRLDTKIGPNTQIEVVTEGVLTRLIREDPELSAYSAVIFDEFHERSLQADLGLALVRESQQVLNERLRLIVMSATLAAEPLLVLLGDVPVLRCEGQAFPVEVRYAPTGRTLLIDHVTQIIVQALAQETGSLLVFLPGEGEIRRVANALSGRLSEEILLCPLYGQLSSEEQDRAISPAPSSARKVVLATSIAETSLTIEGIRVVIDAGLMRVSVFDAGAGLSRLVTQRVSAANAEQRRGRAGRLGPGICIRLWGQEEHARLQAHAVPEILQTDLAHTVLELAAWGVREPSGVAWLDQPPMPAWQQARELLQALNALAQDGGITEHGKAMLKLGLSPRLAHLVLVGRARGRGRLAAELAALLSERDILPPQSGADMHLRLRVLRGEQELYGIDRGRLRLLRETTKRLSPNVTDQSERLDDVGLLLALSFPDHIAKRRAGSAPRYLMKNGRGAVLADEDALANCEWIVAVQVDGQAKESRIFQAVEVLRGDVEEAFADALQEQDELSWDAQNGVVIARKVKKLGAIILEEKPLQKPQAEQLAAVLTQGIYQAGLQVFPWTPALRDWQSRVLIMRALEPELWPDVSDSALLERLDVWAAPFLDGVTRLSALASFPLQDALSSLLDWAMQQELERQLPRKLTVPSGSEVEIDYASEHGPVLAVKLQEMFGLMTTPTLANGRITLKVHLLSPAKRPVAVTSDLASFWKQAYPEVRKDLRGRYPKHPWPEDPLTAVAQRGVKRKPE